MDNENGTHNVRNPGKGCMGDIFVVYYESIKRGLKIKPISECRCDERLKTKARQESTRLVNCFDSE